MGFYGFLISVNKIDNQPLIINIRLGRLTLYEDFRVTN